MDGTLISKGGVMTGGMSRNLESRAQRWDEKATSSLKEVPSRISSCRLYTPTAAFNLDQAVTPRVISITVRTLLPRQMEHRYSSLVNPPPAL